MSNIQLQSLYGLSQEEINKLDEIEESQRKFHQWLRKKERITEAEKRSLDCTNLEDAAKMWTEMSTVAKTEYDLEHQKGWKSWAKKYQNFATGAGEFLRDFEPFVSAAQNSGPYGALAAATLSAVFAIAQSRTRTDEIIASAIAGVKDRLPGFRLYQEIYSNPNEHEQRLRKKILLAYVGVLELAIEAAQHYMKSGLKRWGQATLNPDKFQDLAVNVQDAVVAVRLQCEELLNLAVHDIRRSNGELVEQNKELLEQNRQLRADVARLQVDSDDRNLRRLQRLLGLGEWSAEMQRSRLQTYESSLTREQADNSLSEAMYSGSIARYKQKAHFREWETPGEAAMLLVVGAYSEPFQQQNHCWMSPLALDLIHHYQASYGTHAYYVFDIWKWTGAREVLCDILLQLLRWQRHALAANDCLNTLSANLESYQHIVATTSGADDDERAIQALQEAAVFTIQLFDPQHTIYIVVDRIDRCKHDERIALLDTFTQMMEEASCCVKIFAVADQGKTTWDVDSRSLQKPRRARFATVVETQEVLLGR